MIEENNNIFLGGSNALVYLAELMHKKYSTKFVWGYLVRTYLVTNFSTSLPLYVPVHMIPLMTPCAVHILNGWLLFQPKNK